MTSPSIQDETLLMGHSQHAPTTGQTSPHCPACGSGRITDFYRVDDVPVHSCLLLDDPNAALAFPRGDMRLANCEECGLVVNLAFDNSRVSYGGGYEESQHGSARFRQFAESLIVRLVRDYHLEGKSVLEIGCGKGEFLELFASTGVSSCLGMDPTCDPSRVPSRDDGRLRFDSRAFDERTTGLSPDFIVCRHTLEHIFDVRRFVTLVAGVVASRPGTTAFFEVPDATRILKEGAFWDIYYEHSSYFTPGALARLFRSCGLNVIELWREFDDQYLCMTVSADGKSIDQRQVLEQLEESPGDVQDMTRQFLAVCDDRIAGLRRLISTASDQRARIAVWGSGSKCAGLLHTLKMDSQIHAIVDVNPRKQGRFQPGCRLEIVAPSVLQTVVPDIVIVMNRIYEQEIRAELAALDLTPQVYCL